MALKRAESRLTALRSPYCLLVEDGSIQDLPGLLLPYYRSPWRVEIRILYKDGEEARRQWLFREGSLTRLAAVFTRNAEEDDGEEAEPEGEEEPEEDGGEEDRPLGFIEIFGDHGLITTERQFLEDGELAIDYIYRSARAQGNLSGNRQVLVRAETRRLSFDGESEDSEGSGESAQNILYTDYYRYTRNHSLRIIERIFPPPSEKREDSEDGAQNSIVQLRFPRRSLDSETEISFVSPVLAYGSRFLEDARPGDLQRVVYTTDPRGRILSETRTDEEGNILGEIRNTWTGDRLTRVVQQTGEEERVIEYSYNQEGDRIEERNYRNGVMERVVHVQGNREEEELYMNGELFLRALWEDGRKVREEQVRSSRQGTRRRAPREGNP
ncbi:MAG: hypothetical protein LBH51_03300 [Treponema sp.]|nr:hypothetical protein [Treponema sp.]